MNNNEKLKLSLEELQQFVISTDCRHQDEWFHHVELWSNNYNLSAFKLIFLLPNPDFNNTEALNRTSFKVFVTDTEICLSYRVLLLNT